MSSQPSPSDPRPTPPEPSSSEDNEELSESPYTIPNALTLARIIACPFLGYQIVQGDYVLATSLLFACGVSDWLDGYLARRWGGKSVLGSILDPAADKTLMTTLVITLAWAGLLPVPLAALILGRDAALTISAFNFRYISLPPPRTVGRFFNPSIPSAEVKPTQISKINTALQLVLMGVTTVSPLITYPIGVPLEYLQWVVAGTTIWSGLSYVAGAGVRILPRKGKKL
ncbi:CDP-alcohol phosphatidyltransferase-domain-containing protein [Papiliotrema laurentii]|uniref:CDP-alcohol phosphatidyltransferase-domain-containing protein n=1 Tax=Papiliotrema laurentii TaxID=5418 RepID=A0AAD9FST1_PAPLA|nr:CDP-alcohol phosphatidyltransferase-domain-containing protein [Papiliotrema laurentii]